jgi:hypothetical protein
MNDQVHKVHKVRKVRKVRKVLLSTLSTPCTRALVHLCALPCSKVEPSPGACHFTPATR